MEANNRDEKPGNPVCEVCRRAIPLNAPYYLTRDNRVLCAKHRTFVDFTVIRFNDEKPACQTGATNG
jgi:hypothetical protein